MELRKVSKAIAGAVASGATGGISPLIIIPENVDTPWWGYVIAAALSAVIGFGVTYFAPKNAPSRTSY